MQVHYDNYQRQTGIVDNSGFRLTVTNVLRPESTGVLFMGAALDLLQVPPQQPLFEVTATCPPAHRTQNCPYCDPLKWKNWLDGENSTIIA